MIRIDGSQGEGGGQVLRTALALAALTGQAVEIVNIRARRRNPGLAPQHLAGVLAAARICNAEVEGAHIRSTRLIFRPATSPQAGDYEFDISRMAAQSSAGAVTLLLQTVLLPLALADGPSYLLLRGGTHVAWSPPVHYVEWVLLPTLTRLGLRASIRLVTWGWYPIGGGQVEVTIEGGARLQGIDLTQRGALVELKGVAAASNLPSHIPQRMAARANNLLREAGLPTNIQPLRTGGPSTGAGLFVAVRYEHSIAGFSALGERGKPSDVVAEEAIRPLITFHQQQAALDEHLPDQLIPALALAEGPSVLSTVAITQHVLTNIAIVQHFIKRPIKVEGAEGQAGIIRVEGTSAP